ncbi:hypothetical protein [Nostoc sp.]|uniref:hypothetical protein n=1 Tax=Nostoc sp. TaxID=1180 RepID=UPI002FFC7BEF
MCIELHVADPGLTQELSETLISLCRASCYPTGTLRANKSLNRKGTLASLRTLRFNFPLPVRKSCDLFISQAYLVVCQPKLLDEGWGKAKLTSCTKPKEVE